MTVTGRIGAKPVRPTTLFEARPATGKSRARAKRARGKRERRERSDRSDRTGGGRAVEEWEGDSGRPSGAGWGRADGPAERERSRRLSHTLSRPARPGEVVGVSGQTAITAGWSPFTGDMEAWERRRIRRLAVPLYGALCAVYAHRSVQDAHREVGDVSSSVRAAADPLSLDNCEQLPTSRRPGITDEHDVSLDERAAKLVPLLVRAGVTDLDRAVRLADLIRNRSDIAVGALQAPERAETAFALVEAGELSMAERYVYCCRRSTQLLCAEDFGGCGCRDNYTPMTCGVGLCVHCGGRRFGTLVEQYAPVVESWQNPKMLTFTTRNVEDPEAGVDEIVDAFGKLRRRVIPTEGETVREGVTKRWCWRSDGGQPADRWATKLAGAKARDLEARYVREGRGIPFEEVVRGGLYGIDVKEQQDGTYNVHIHVLADAWYVPQAALSAVWEEITGAPVVDVRAVYGGAKEGLKEVVGYVTKPPEFETLDAAVGFVTGMKGRRLVQPFGRLHGNTPEVGDHLLCSRCESRPNLWVYLGTVDEYRSTMGTVHGGDDDRPPPG